MDPNANMSEQLSLARKIASDFGDGDGAWHVANAPDLIEPAARLAELVLALHEWRANGGFEPASDTVWNFWLPDSDRSTGWTNHGYVLQFVCAGHGATPEEAWHNARRAGNVPQGFLLPDTLTCIPAAVEVTKRVSRGGKRA